jgi:enoyl-CoA hydratase
MSLADAIAGQRSPEGDLVRTWRQGPAVYLQLNRPEKANAYNRALLDALGDAFDQAVDDPALRLLIITGAGTRAFCGGADLAEFSERDWQSALRLKSAELFARISRCRLVTLAAINGAAVAGGLELALACDLRIAALSACFSLPEPELGLIPAAGGTQRLADAVGRARAKELILGGRVWGADEALRFGLVSEVTGPDELLPLAQQWAERIARRNAVALELAKRAIDLGRTDVPGQSFESVAQALLYHLRRGGGPPG